MFDVLAFPDSCHATEALLSAPIATGPRDSTLFLCLGRVRHLGRWRPCGWHLAVHHDEEGESWTHLYRVLAEHGDRLLVLLHRAAPGERRVRMEMFSGWPLPVLAGDCEAG